MLRIIIPGEEFFDDSLQEFTTVGDVALDLEHSLVSLSKWESIYEKPFLGDEKKTSEETFGYIRTMLIDPEIPPGVFSKITESNISEINEYIDAKMTATWFADQRGTPKTREIITAELIYYWMIVFQIPFECETWHLNRLFTLIRICNIKNAAPKKMSRAEQAAQNKRLNAERKAKLGTRG